MNKRKIIIGTRGSELALWQTNYVKNILQAKIKDIYIELKIIKTKGDKNLNLPLAKIGDKGLFTKELEQKILSGEIDIAVHSLKDMETNLPDGLKIGAVLKRAKPNDIIISRKKGTTLLNLPFEAKVATGSIRRTAQILHLRPDLKLFDLRGNVPTRIEKFFQSDWDAIILARAGVERLNLKRYISSVISVKQILPAVGQGAIAIECRANDNEILSILKKINHQKSLIEVRAEREFLRVLEGGCRFPICALAKIQNDKLILEGKVLSLDGSICYEGNISGSIKNSKGLGKKLAQKLINAGAEKILKTKF